MILTKDTLQVGTKFARIMLVTNIDGGFSTIVSYTGVVLELTNEYDDAFRSNQLKYSYSDGHPKSTPQWGYVGDLLGHDDTVICVPLEELDTYNTPDAFGDDARNRIIRDMKENAALDTMLWAIDQGDWYTFPDEKY